MKSTKEDKTEVQERFKYIMERKLGNKFISAGSLIRFRDACIQEGKQQTLKGYVRIKDVEMFIKDMFLELYGRTDMRMFKEELPNEFLLKLKELEVGKK